MAIVNIVGPSQERSVTYGSLSVSKDRRKINLLELVPEPFSLAEYKQRADESIDHGDLERFLEVLWVVLETVANKVDGLSKLSDVDDCPDEFLSFLGENVGITVEDFLLVDQKRSKIKSAIQWYRIKGTLPSFQTSIRYLGLSTDHVKIHEVWKDVGQPGVLIKEDEVTPGYDRVSVDSLYRASILLCELLREDPGDWRAWTVSEWRSLIEIYREIKPVHVDIIWRVLQRILEEANPEESVVQTVERIIVEADDPQELMVRLQQDILNEGVHAYDNRYVDVNYWALDYTEENIFSEATVNYWWHLFDAANYDVDPQTFLGTIVAGDFYIFWYSQGGWWNERYWHPTYWSNYWFNQTSGIEYPPVYADLLETDYDGPGREASARLFFDLTVGEMLQFRDSFVLRGPAGIEFGPGTPYYTNLEMYQIDPLHSPLQTQNLCLEIKWHDWA